MASRKSSTAVAVPAVSPETMEMVVSKFPELRAVMTAPLVPDTEALQSTFGVEIATLKEFAVTDKLSRDQAAIHLANVKAWKKIAEGVFDRFCEIFNFVHKWGTSNRAALAGQADPIITHLSRQILAWEDSEKQRAQREREEFEKARRAYEADQKRIADEAAAAAMAARLAQDIAEAEARKVPAAVDLFDDDPPEVAAVAVLPPPVSAPLVARPLPPRPAETSLPIGATRNLPYHAVLDDYSAFIKWVAEKPEERGKFAPAAMPELNRVARAMEQSINIPGVRAERDRTVSS